jgi:hypothetical protein
VRRILLTALVVTACAAPSPEPVPAPASPTAVGATPAIPAQPTPAAATSTPAPAPLPRSRGVVARGLGRATGEWVFLVNDVPGRFNIGGGDREVWAVRADGAVAHRVALFAPYWGGPIFGGIQDTVLSQQLSPDGRTLLLPAYADPDGFELHAIDIATGATRQLVPDRQFTESAPIWSPSGDLVAFSRNRSDADPRQPYTPELWVVRPDGSDARHIATISGSTLGFTIDGREVCFRAAVTSCIAVATGAKRDVSSTELASVGLPEPPTAIGTRAQDVRRNPKSGELVYRIGSEAFTYSTSGIVRVEVREAVRRATWSHDGSALYVITVQNATVPVPFTSVWSSLRRVAGGTETELLRPFLSHAHGLRDVRSVLVNFDVTGAPSCSTSAASSISTGFYRQRYDIGWLHREGFVVIAIAECRDPAQVLSRLGLAGRTLLTTGPQGVEEGLDLRADHWYLVRVASGSEFREAERLSGFQPPDLAYVDLMWQPISAATAAKSVVNPARGPRGTNFELQFCCWTNHADVEKVFTTPDGRTVVLNDKVRSDYTVRAGWGSGPNDALGTYEVRVVGIGLAAVQRFHID